jgi:superfamily II DNA/RNA helicase
MKGELVQIMEHVYYEVGTSLLAKPQALCDLIELEAGHSCLVYCNSPSDADFADVILKKRGISSLKLIGYVPQIKLSKAIQQLQKKEVAALVLTDVAARGLPLEEFDIVVNYSIPTDPEIYFHRYASETEECKTKKVISLVAALDISNFHYLKKLGKLEFVQGELPTPETLFVTKFASLRDQAIEKSLVADSGISTLVDTVLGDANVRDIVALLLHNTISVIPALKAAPPAREESADYREEEDEGDEGGRGDGRRRHGQGRDRGNRDDRGGRGGRDRDRGQRGGRGRRDQEGGEFEDDDQSQRMFLEGADGEAPRHGRGRGRGRDRDHRRDGDRSDDDRQPLQPRQPRQPRREMPVDKEARLYVGAGSQQGISHESLSNDVVSACGINASDIHRVSVRGAYSFVDVPEAVADQVVEKLGESVSAAGAKYFVKKAVTLTIPREGAHEEAQHSEAVDNGGADISHDDIGDGPTMLAVDETA